MHNSKLSFTVEIRLFHYCGINTAQGKYGVSLSIKELSLLGRDATSLGKRSQKFQMNVVPSSSTAIQV